MCFSDVLHSDVGIFKIVVAHHLFETRVGRISYHCLCLTGLDGSLNFALGEILIVSPDSLDHGEPMRLPQVDIWHPLAQAHS